MLCFRFYPQIYVNSSWFCLVYSNDDEKKLLQLVFNFHSVVVVILEYVLCHFVCIGFDLLNKRMLLIFHFMFIKLKCITRWIMLMG